jgi:hypothetical protein
MQHTTDLSVNKRLSFFCSIFVQPSAVGRRLKYTSYSESENMFPLTFIIGRIFTYKQILPSNSHPIRMESGPNLQAAYSTWSVLSFPRSRCRERSVYEVTKFFSVVSIFEFTFL